MTAQSKPIRNLDKMPVEVDFSGATRGKFHKASVKLNVPVYLDSDVQAFLAALAAKKGTSISRVVNDLLRKHIELLDVLR